MKHPVAYLHLPAWLCLGRLEEWPQSLFLVDWALGAMLAWLVYDRLELTPWYYAHYLRLFIEQLGASVQWLMGYPAGLKLNGDATRFLGGLFLWLIGLWEMAVDRMVQQGDGGLKFILMAMGLLGGLSGLVALLVDLWTLLTAHLHFFHLISARIFGWELFVLGSLFRLFRGKRRNPLRQRTDSAEYALDQQLLGTVFLAFTVAMLPTLAVYYWLFLLLRLATALPVLAFDFLFQRLGFLVSLPHQRILTPIT